MFLCNRNTGRRLLSSSNLGSFMLSELDISGHCGVLKASWASNMVYSRGRQLMLAVGWKLEHLHMISSVFSLDEEGFLTQWLISFKANVLSGENQVKVAQHFLTQPQKWHTILTTSLFYTKESLKAAEINQDGGIHLASEWETIKQVSEWPQYLISGIWTQAVLALWTTLNQVYFVLPCFRKKQRYVSSFSLAIVKRKVKQSDF